MEYTNNEKHVLSLMDRTDFKNLSKIDIGSHHALASSAGFEVQSGFLPQCRGQAQYYQKLIY